MIDGFSTSDWLAVAAMIAFILAVGLGKAQPPKR